MNDLEKLADVVASYRKKIKAFEETSFYIVGDYQTLLLDFSNEIENISFKVNHKLAYVFMKHYESIEDALFEITTMMDDLFENIDRLKEIYVATNENEDEIYHIINRAVYKILTQVELFFVKLENLILKGGSGDLLLTLEADDEIYQLKERLGEPSKRSGFLQGLLVGLGFGWMFGSE